MIFREAQIEDIKHLMLVRLSVHENVLSDPGLIKEKDYKDYLTSRGKGWLCEVNNTIAGFSIVDLVNHNIWALFVLPEFEKLGIGKRLQELMLDWYFSHTDQNVWLSTAPGSRAELFYRISGWDAVGNYGKVEIKFEMSSAKWKNR
ncbi:MAG: GNAT family N-acetyltransferase [Chitinophagales bacterium]|nr:GNAT family N-acetyltransferase [Chitinophagales bacterium]